MERPVSPNMKDLQLLKAATTLLLEHAYNELKDKNDNIDLGDKKKEMLPKTSIFGKAAPIVTLEGAVRLVIALTQVNEGQEMSAPELLLSDADMALVENFLHRARKRDRQALLPHPHS